MERKPSEIYRQLYPSSSARELSVPRVGLAKLLAVGGGKGGVGKSLISSNLGLIYAGSGREVVLLDADLGGANLHTLLGENPPQLGLSDFLSGHVSRLEELRSRTNFGRLSLVNGAKDAVGIANLKYTQKKKILDQVRGLPSDLVIIDVGAGTGYNMTDFFLIADLGLIVVTPEPPSIENAYRFLRAAVLRRVRQLLTHQAALSLVDQQLSASSGRALASPLEIFNQLRRLDRQSYDTVEMALSGMNFALVMNMMRKEDDFRIGEAMEKACRMYFGLPIPFLGGLRYEDTVWSCVRERRPLIVAEPDCQAALNLKQIAEEVHGRLFQKSL